MRSVWILPVLLAVVLAVVPACSYTRRDCVPGDLATSKNLIDLNLPEGAHAPVTGNMVRELADRSNAAPRPPGRPYHFLALSGGGLYGAFGTGVLLGWGETGTRPQFDVVTGISTGSLIATPALLGPEYEYMLQPYLEGVNRRDILRLRSPLRLPFADAPFSAAPLARMIEEAITPEVLCAVAKAHAAGRRLYIGTSNLDTRRLIIWDMGEIATRGTPEALDLYRKVTLASCSVPGAFPPVRIPVEINGKWYEELHADGAANDSVIFRSFMVADLNRAAGIPGARAPAGSTLYVIENGKLYADPKCTKPRLFAIGNSAMRSVLDGKTRDEYYRIYLNCLKTGVDFRLATIPQELPISKAGSLNLPREDQRRILSAGFQVGRAGPNSPAWRDVPPGTDAAEQALPRAGTRFIVGEPPPPVGP